MDEVLFQSFKKKFRLFLKTLTKEELDTFKNFVDYTEYASEQISFLIFEEHKSRPHDAT